MVKAPTRKEGEPASVGGTGQQQYVEQNGKKRTPVGRPGGATDAHLGCTPVAEDEGVIDDDIKTDGGDADTQNGPGLAPTAVEAGQGRRQDQRAHTVAQDAEVVDLVGTHFGVVTDQLKYGRGEQCHQQAGDDTDDGQIHALPYGWTHPLGSPGADILGDEGIDVARRPQKQADENEIGHTCRQ